MRIGRNGIETGTIGWSSLAWILVALISFWHMLAVRLDGEMDKYVIGSDGSGYYAYLPATFIYQDFSYSFADPNAKGHKAYHGNNMYQFVSRNSEGKLVNKYFLGSSLLMLPFFLLACFFSWIFDYPVDGYSFLFQSFVCIAGIFYLLAGLHYLRRLLLRAGIRDGVTGLILLVVFLGTNLYHYALEEPSMSHVYSFAAISFFLWQAWCFFEKGERKNFILAVCAFLVVLAIRPVNGMLLFACPFLYFMTGTRVENLRRITSFGKALLIPIAAGTLLVFFQMLSWKLSVGAWLTDSYTKEKFDFTSPHLLSVLFSWRKGFFIYTPVLLFMIPGLYFIRKFNAALSFTLFFLVNCWLISCWHDWGYGGSLGFRPLIDYYALFAIPLAYFLNSLHKRIAAAGTGLVLFFFCALNISQHYQYHFGILPWEDMTEYKYKRLFFRHEKIFSGIFSPDKNMQGTVPEGSRKFATLKRNFENDSGYSNFTGVSKDKLSFSSPAAVCLDETVKISPDLYFYLDDHIPDSLLDRSWVEVTVKTWLTNELSDAKLVVSFFDEESNYSWNGRYLIHRVDKTFSWENYRYAFKIPAPPKGKGRVSVYVLKEDQSILYIDDLEVALWAEPGKSKHP